MMAWHGKDFRSTGHLAGVIYHLTKSQYPHKWPVIPGRLLAESFGVFFIIKLNSIEHTVELLKIYDAHVTTL